MSEPYCEICGRNFAVTEPSNMYSDLRAECAEDFLVKDEDDEDYN